jgi:transcriptional regulator with XRE-family HTH domain
MTELSLRLARKLKETRISKGYEQKYVAAQIGISGSKLGNYENGRSEPDVDTIRKLSEFYDISLDEWLKTKDNSDKTLLVTQKEEVNMLSNYRELPEPLKKDVQDYIIYKYGKKDRRNPDA